MMFSVIGSALPCSFLIVEVINVPVEFCGFGCHRQSSPASVYSDSNPFWRFDYKVKWWIHASFITPKSSIYEIPTAPIYSTRLYIVAGWGTSEMGRSFIASGDCDENPTKRRPSFSIILVPREPGASLSSDRVWLLVRKLFCVQNGVCGLCQNAERETVSAWSYITPGIGVHIGACVFDRLRL